MERRVFLRPSVQECARIDVGDGTPRCACDERFAIQDVDDSRRISGIDTGPLREFAQANRRPEVAEGPNEPTGLGALEGLTLRGLGSGFSRAPVVSMKRPG